MLDYNDNTPWRKSMVLVPTLTKSMYVVLKGSWEPEKII